MTKLNNTKLDRIGMTPAKAVKLEHVTLNIKAYPKEDTLPVDGLYRYSTNRENSRGASKDGPRT